MKTAIKRVFAKILRSFGFIPDKPLDMPNVSPIPIDTKILMSSVDIFNLTPDCYKRKTDVKISSVSLDTFLSLVAACHSDRLRYVPEIRDCDDFTRIFRGWLSEYGYGNLAVAECFLQGLKPNGKWYAHSMLLFVDNTYTPYLIEPQNDKVFSVANQNLAIAGASKIELYHIVF